jgi:LAS superfamily LD-carboxypeptidase LdcB
VLGPPSSFDPLAQSAAAQSSVDDVTRQRDEVRRQQVEVAGQIDTLRASDAEVAAALGVLTAHVAAQRDLLADTQRALQQATEDIRAAEREEQAAQGRLDALGSELRELALSSYIRPPDQVDADVMLGGSPLDAPKRNALARFRLRGLDDVIDQVKSRKDDVRRAQHKAETARQEADAAQAAQTARLADLEAAAAQHAQVAAGIEDRLDRALSEAAGLARRDGNLSAEIQRQQAELARQAAIARQQADAALAVAVNTTAPRSSGSASPGSASPGSAFSASAVRSSGSVTVASVRGIEVSADIAPQVAALLAQAEADGITLDGSGYRSTGEQIEIRRQVCGASDYAIWEMPSSSCSPPVARPGRSMHEKGLAIDFIVDGDLIRSRARPEYQWLAANAARYGLYNLPSEPWHWSTTGS